MNNVEKVIEAFGGVTLASKAMGIPLTTVHSWKYSPHGIPSWRRATVIAAAKRKKILDKLPAEYQDK
ncbi:hypothetical protein UFOVP1425_85, partial [uncultured Caudovirales phage]